MTKIYIAVLGYGSMCSEQNKRLAFEVGCSIAINKAVVVCGGLGGVFFHAFEGAKKNGGETIAILGQKSDKEELVICDHIINTGVGTAKHAIIANTCDGAIVVGGWINTLSVVSEFIALKKPIVLLEETGGVASTYTNSELIAGSNIYLEHFKKPVECVSYLLEKIKNRTVIQV